MGEAGQAPGWFGKLPSHGDFLVRRLPPEVRLCFDNWLQAGLVESRIALGDAWLPTWLSSPLWRFVVSAGVCGEQAWAGVMMPSHDRVGRTFPLLLMAASEGTPSLPGCMTVHAGWFARLEALALSTLEEGFSLERFDAALAALAALGAAPRAGSSSAAAPAPLAGRAAVVLLDDAVLPALAERVMTGHSAWWTDGSPRVGPCLALCRHLPAPAAFAALLDGQWEQHGWNRD